jgi:hypothetical protein
MAYINAQKSFQDTLYDLKYGNVNVGGGKTRRQLLSEAATIEQIVNWFHVLYSQIDTRISDSQDDKNVELENLYRKVRSYLRDYEPRVGDQIMVVIKRLKLLYDELKALTEEYTGSIGDYVKALTQQLERILTKENPEDIAALIPGEEAPAEEPAKEEPPAEAAPEIVPKE